MDITHLKIVEEDKILSPVQKEFNRLNAQIEKIRKDIEILPAKIKIIRDFQFERLNPVKERQQKLKIEFLKKLDFMYETTKLTSNQKEDLANIILEDASELKITMLHHPDIGEIKEIHDKYSKVLYTEKELNEMKADEKGMLKSISEVFFGLDMEGFEDVPEDEYEDFFRQKVDEKITEEQEEQEYWKANQQNFGSKTKKNAAQQKRDEEKKAESDVSLKTLREVYTDLVKKLHPDREKDEKLRLEKTEQLKLVTEAYERKDLATLLVMQIQWLQHTGKDPKKQPDDVLARYNRVLKMHITKLEQEFRELLRRPLPFDNNFESFHMLKKTERAIRNALARQEREMKMELDYNESRFVRIHKVSGLKQYIMERVAEVDMDDLFLDMFSSGRF